MTGQSTATLSVGIIIAVLMMAVNCQELDEISSSVNRPGVCALPSDTGPCRANMKRYFYNVQSGACEQFVYGGCQGNRNNFKTLLQCQLYCNQRVVCQASPESGFCEAYFPSYFYNSTSGKCEKFVYGGCGGNANRFSSKQQCNDKCVCSQPPVTGPCELAFPAFYYNARKNTCVPFIYGGCKGNSNRFSDANTCQETCGGR
ncbi:hypothetical protein EMCRGX_G010557 [Ephydatia muelleri]|eukprot:Em0003g1822a